MERDFIMWLIGYMEGLDGVECAKPYFDTIREKVAGMFITPMNETYEEMKLRLYWEDLDNKKPN